MTAQERFAQLASGAARSGVLSRVTFSRPSADGEELRVTATLYRSADGSVMVRADTALSDGKVIRKNYTPDESGAYFKLLSARYRQGNLSAGGAEAQYMVSKKGKATLSGERAVSDAISSAAPTVVGDADTKQRYFWDGGEDFLVALGISDKNGRVHDKRQSKFRQINRFTELLDDVYGSLPSEGTLTVCDLCCGKSYLSFAVYAYLTAVRGRSVRMLGVDRKRDVIEYCESVAREIGADGLHFVAADVSDDNVYGQFGGRADLVVSLHACDIATDIVLRRAVELDARVILSTPCCHHELYGKVKSAPLSFITSHSMLAQKLNDAVTDGLRVKMLEAEGYRVATVELIDPDETPKNVMIRAVKKRGQRNRDKLIGEYNAIVDFLGIAGSYYDIYRENK